MVLYTKFYLGDRLNIYLVVHMESSSEENWVKDLHEFVSHWEEKVANIKEKRLGSQECTEIADLFQKDQEVLLSRRPVGVSDDHVFVKLQPLANKLDASLAMALCSDVQRPEE